MISYNYKVVHFNNLKNTKFCIFFKVTSPPCFWSGPPLLWTWQLNRPSTPPSVYYILLASDPKRWPGVLFLPYLLLQQQRGGRLHRGRCVKNNLRSRTFRPNKRRTDDGGRRPAARSPAAAPASAFLIIFCSPATCGPKELITSSTYLIFFSSSLSITTYVYTKAGAVRRSLSALALTYHAHKISLMRNWRMM